MANTGGRSLRSDNLGDFDQLRVMQRSTNMSTAMSAFSGSGNSPQGALCHHLGRCRREVPRIFLISSTNSQENLILVRCNVRGRPRTRPLNGGGKNMKRIA